MLAQLFHAGTLRNVADIPFPAGHFAAMGFHHPVDQLRGILSGGAPLIVPILMEIGAIWEVPQKLANQIFLLHRSVEML